MKVPPAPIVAFVFVLSSVFATSPEVVEPEDNPFNGDVMIQEEEGASGGSYVRTEKRYGPLFATPVPDGSEPLTIWVRARGHAVCLKAIDNEGTQTELKWIFGMPAEWSWRSFGTFDRGRLQSKLLIIRSDSATEDAGLDAVILSEDPGFDPNTMSPNS
ncbi:MAG: hypothetical protein SFU53_16300 [Terrimicrobiaceae bacterium]|nr:hypothetical protein [Terrimicrobiaceae bacterium]